MARTLLTGASGFIGSHLARALLERGDDLVITVRDTARRENLDALDVASVVCDVRDRRAVRRALRGVERVFHAAGSTNLRLGREQLFTINVVGTRIVLEEALRAGVQRVVHTSSVAAIGPAPRGGTADERQMFSARRLGIPYADAKHEAETEALRLGAQGLPVVIVNPALVLGRGDVYRASTTLVRRFLRREIPAYVDGALNIVDVSDVARGHLLADEQGRLGERYILGGRNFTLDLLFADLARISGVEAPAVKLPMSLALALAEAGERLPLGMVSVAEVRAAGQWWTYRSTKARRELGWSATPHEETLESTVAWYRARERDRLAPPGARQPRALRAVAWWERQLARTADRLRG